jgi:hypothetical protein
VTDMGADGRKALVRFWARKLAKRTLTSPNGLGTFRQAPARPVDGAESAHLARRGAQRLLRRAIDHIQVRQPQPRVHLGRDGSQTYTIGHAHERPGHRRIAGAIEVGFGRV